MAKKRDLLIAIKNLEERISELEERIFILEMRPLLLQSYQGDDRPEGFRPPFDPDYQFTGVLAKGWSYQTIIYGENTIYGRPYKIGV